MEDFTPSEQLVQFLDGELPIEQEESLFVEMAANPELRAEMRDGLAMRSAISKDIEAFTPTPEQTRAVFAGLGFKNPLAPDRGENTTRYRTLPLVWLFFGVSIGALLSYMYSNNDFQKRYEALRTSMQSKVESLTAQIKNTPPTVSSYEVKDDAENKPKETIRTVIVYRDRFVPTYSAVDNNSLFSERMPSEELDREPADGNTITLNDPTQFSPAALSQGANVSLQPRTLPNYSGFAVNNRLSFRSEDFPQFWLQVRGIGTLTQNPDLAASSVISGLGNVNVAIGYSFNENLAAGVELGREPFMLRYSGVTKGRKFNYEQQSSMLLGGLMLQGKMDHIESLDNIQPVGTIFLGGSEIGLLGRLSLGVYYPFNKSVAFYGGIEYSVLGFQYQSVSYDAQKLGITYGMQFRF